ncbi:radical SAM protein [Streptomyces sp. NEAU-H3]|uniref:radical SAM protein n=1 Tax=Streptomyces sp. NEAU-H3 TaxID=2720636 RepID=UPI00280B980D|nr:radical SAM protein [Streptomyces sp. NEAU-H3]
MIREVTGIETIRMLYLQLLYRCNFACLHCFHGERLQHADAFTVGEAAGLLTLMRDEYGTEAVTLLGGEPFVYRELPEVVRYAKEELGLRVEICTNGYPRSKASVRPTTPSAGPADSPAPSTPCARPATSGSLPVRR